MTKAWPFITIPVAIGGVALLVLVLSTFPRESGAVRVTGISGPSRLGKALDDWGGGAHARRAALVGAVVADLPV